MFVSVDDIESAIDTYRDLGYRLDMIVPADAPREALMSRGSETIRLRSERAAAAGHSKWTKGRAGMEYRELLPGRLGGKVVASQIRLTLGGEVPDYVHYHRIAFQMIYCTRGRILAAYEDQGPPFWIETGDCILQPPEIRHRVYECTAGAEVIEVGMPAEHETWVDHEIALPTPETRPERQFGGQLFLRHIAADAEWQESRFSGYIERDTGISIASRGTADVRVLRPTGSKSKLASAPENGLLVFGLRNKEILIIAWDAGN